MSFNKNSFGEFFKRGILRGMSTCGEKNCATSKSNKIILSKSFFFKRFFILMKKSHGNQSRPAVIKFELQLLHLSLLFRHVLALLLFVKHRETVEKILD